MIICGLDIETKSKVEDHEEYALQPWRVKDDEVEITHIGLSVKNERSKAINFSTPILNSEMTEIEYCFGRTHFVTFNGVFDIAFLHAAGFDVGAFEWIDVMLVWKWMVNGQKRERIPAWSLVDAVNEFFPQVQWADEFVEMKENEDRDDAYWEKRSKADAFATVQLFNKIWPQLTAQQKKSALIEAKCLVPVAKSWVRGVKMNLKEVESKRTPISNEMAEIEQSLSTTRKVLSSPKQLCELLYDVWGLTVNQDLLTPKEARSSSKANLTYLADDDKRATEILRWRKLNTQLTKFLQSPLKAQQYIGSSILHPAPKLFSTYTGRMTYGSKVLKKYLVGMALHQWPREKEIRALIEPPEGYDLVELDASGQEMRLMADSSQDEAMLKVFRNSPPDDDAHSYTGAQLAGIPFEKFLELKREGNKAVTGEHGYRYQGKFTNLSKQYRIGLKKLRVKSRVDYGMILSFVQVKALSDTYMRAYPGIKRYWSEAIELGRFQGYAETRAGRRFYLTDWNYNEFGTGQSAINFPIQGTGGDMKELGLAVLTESYPDLIFGFDLHDALFMYIRSNHPKKMVIIKGAQKTLNNLPYKAAWGWEPSIPIPWDASIGPDWGHMESV